MKIIEENYLERTQGKKRLLTLDLKHLKTLKIILQRKASHRQGIPESRCAIK